MPSPRDRNKPSNWPRPAGATPDSEPQIPEHDPADLENDQADSGPDRDRNDIGS